MTKRLIAIALWSFCGLYSGTYLAYLAEASPVVGQVTGLIVGLLIGADPRTYLAAQLSRQPLPVSNASNRTYGNAVAPISQGDVRQAG